MKIPLLNCAQKFLGTLLLASFTGSFAPGDGTDASRLDASKVQKCPLTESICEPRSLVQEGEFAQAEQKVAEAQAAQGAGADSDDLMVALELWGMASEARNQARSAEASELVKRAKRRLAKAALSATTAEDAAHIARLRSQLAEQFPQDEREVASRRRELEDAQKNVVGAKMDREVVQ